MLAWMKTIGRPSLRAASGVDTAGLGQDQQRQLAPSSVLPKLSYLASGLDDTMPLTMRITSS